MRDSSGSSSSSMNSLYSAASMQSLDAAEEEEELEDEDEGYEASLKRRGSKRKKRCSQNQEQKSGERRTSSLSMQAKPQGLLNKAKFAAKKSVSDPYLLPNAFGN